MIVRIFLALVTAGIAGTGPAWASDTPRGFLRAAREITVAAPVTDRVAIMRLSAGAEVAAGERLAQFACVDAEAAIRLARLELQRADTALSGADRLFRHGVAGANDVAEARLQRDILAARAENLRLRHDACTITAPFAGRIAEVKLAEGEMATIGAPLMKLMDASSLVAEMLAPAAALRGRAEGETVSIRIEDTDEIVPAVIEMLPAVVEPVSQTIRLSARLGTVPAGLRPGMAVSLVNPSAR